jgi:hypothetical protein
MAARRDILKGIAGAALGGGGAWSHLAPAQTPTAGGLPGGAVESGILEAIPGKRPLIKRSFRPPNFETPLPVFNELLTPNDAFFVR